MILLLLSGMLALGPDCLLCQPSSSSSDLTLPPHPFPSQHQRMQSVVDELAGELESRVERYALVIREREDNDHGNVCGRKSKMER